MILQNKGVINYKTARLGKDRKGEKKPQDEPATIRKHLRKINLKANKLSNHTATPNEIKIME